MLSHDGTSGVRRQTYVLAVTRERGRPGGIHAEAQVAGWPVPVFPPRDAPSDARRQWFRLYKRLRWALRMEADVRSSLRAGARLARLKVAARERGLEVDISLDEYRVVIAAGRCHYCAGPLPASGHGLDRRSASLGYTRDNVVAACDACNRIKSDVFTYDQMVEIGALLRSWRRQGSWRDPTRKDGRNAGGRPVKGDLCAEIEAWNARWQGGRQLTPGTASPDRVGERRACYAV